MAIVLQDLISSSMIFSSSKQEFHGRETHGGIPTMRVFFRAFGKASEKTFSRNSDSAAEIKQKVIWKCLLFFNNVDHYSTLNSSYGYFKPTAPPPTPHWIFMQNLFLGRGDLMECTYFIFCFKLKDTLKLKLHYGTISNYLL